MTATAKHYKKIMSISVSVLMILLQAYLMLILSGIDLFYFSKVTNIVMRYFLQIMVQLILFSTIYLVIYFTVKFLYCRYWKIKNKNIWVHGIWLHIHIKNEIRIGTVEIQQDFNTINATGYNINLYGEKQKETTWSYILGEIKDEPNARDFIGYYEATKFETQKKIDGVHILKLESTTQKNKYTTRMNGVFRDTFIVEKNAQIDIGDHAGKLFFFRPSNECLKYLYDGNEFRYDRLVKLHKREEFANEQFVIKLKEELKQLN